MPWVVTVNLPDERLPGSTHTHELFYDIAEAGNLVSYLEEIHSVSAQITHIKNEADYRCQQCIDWADTPAAWSGVYERWRMSALRRKNP